ncbi:MAG: hypothetical protein COC19_03130 [SAR86 cluster bacterium]|uniref:PIG-L domain-containing protein n=1 Tax=SAR86 cluster bacterium TaxID=2030880 RepID=A0A2A4MRR7_9GAMM|nr:MAG: hypothetical protein COC19_03130 [SAR86 cluster bacterium]
MIEEHQLIPYQLAELPLGPWLVFAPHADDETFGMGGALLRAADAGIKTHIVVLTDGALGGEKADLVAIRKQEVANVAEFLAVTSLQCWDEPDRGLKITATLIDRVKAHIRELQVASVFFPAPFEPHPDHRSASQLVWQSLAQLYKADPMSCPAPLSYEISVQSPINRLLDITQVMSRKEQAMALYNSQNSENNYPQLVKALNKARTFSLNDTVSYAEGFYAYNKTALANSLEATTKAAMQLYWQ